jgi:hypothetical protein
VALGVAPVDTATWGNGIVLMKFDSNGNLLQSKLIVDELVGQLPIEMRYGNFQPTPDNGYIMSITPFIFEYPVLLKTDHEFNIDFIKIYDDTTGYDYQLSDFTPIEDGYLLFGMMAWNNNDSDGYVRKVDHEGETVWVKYFGNLGKDDSVLDVAVIDDTTFMVAVGHSLGFQIGYFSLVTINANGQTLYQWDSETETDIGYIRDIIAIQEDGILTYGLAVKEYTNSGIALLKSTIAKLDINYNPIAINSYGKLVDATSEIMFYNFAETIDGNYIAAGRTSTESIDNGPTYGRGWLMKFSPEGDSIWSRLDTSDVMPVHYSNRHRLGGVGVLSSGSIVAGGFVTKVEDNSSYIWLIKTTNDGCIDTLYCGLVSSTEEVPPVAQGQVSVYPNPASEVVNITVIGSTGRFEVSVHDATGRLLGSYLSEDDGSLALQVAHLRTGIYYFSIKLPDGQILYKKASVVR